MRGFAAELARLDFAEKLRQSKEIFEQEKLALERERDSLRAELAKARAALLSRS
jgi:hypothetical protein